MKILLIFFLIFPLYLIGQKHIDAADTVHKYRILKGGDTVTVILDTPPKYKGGRGKLYQHLAQEIRYPEDALETNEAGTSYIIFLIDRNGQTSNFKIWRGEYSSLNNEALRVVKDISSNSWIPGILNGEKVDVIYILPVKFVLR